MKLVRLKSSRGNALLGAMVAVGISGVVGMTAIAYNQTFIQSSRMAYVRSAFSSLESNLRFMAMQPYAYSCGREGVINDQLGGYANCTLRRDATGKSYFDSILRINFPGAQCAPDVKACGFVVSDLKFTPTTTAGVTSGVFSAKLSYEGKELSIAPSNIKLDVPADVLQSMIFDCAEVNPLKPVFAGFDPKTGAPVCRGFQDCPKGQYVRTLDFTKMDRKCAPLAPEDGLDCSPSKSGLNQPMIKTMFWTDGVVGKTCDLVKIPPPSGNIDPPTQKPPVNCADLYYSDPQGPAVSGSSTSFTTVFQSTVDKIPSGCTYTDVTIDFRRSGFNGSSCNYVAKYDHLQPGGPSQSMGFLGKKSTYGTAVVNGGSAYLTEYTSGYSTGILAAACISNVVVTVHSKAK